jgi:AraC-like DNA-binding protein
MEPAKLLPGRPALLIARRNLVLSLLQSPVGFAHNPGACLGGRVDVLSEVLRDVKLSGAVYYNAEFSAPWCVQAPASSVMAPQLAPGAEHVIIFHLLTEGGAYARLEDGPAVSLEAGNIVVFPHGDPHRMGNGGTSKPVDAAGELERVLSQHLMVSRVGGGGEVTKIICGYMACDPRLARVFLSGLPRLFTVDIRNDAQGRWLESSILFSVSEARECRAGGDAVLAKLSEVLFVETLRRYIARLPVDQTGWLAGTRDMHVGKALGLMHRRASHPWTIAELAKEVGTSRSVLAERFRHYLDEPPMSYLTRWRLQLAAQMLSATSHSIAQIAMDVGYESEPAFNRAFKRAFGSPPARFRGQSRSTLGSPGVRPR